MSNNKDLTILPIVPLKDTEKLTYHPTLPSVAKNRGFILNIIGSTCCGKTILINNLILGKNFWGGKKNAFDAIYFFSPSVLLDDSCRFIKEHFNCYTEYSDEELQKILDIQSSYDVKDMPRILIVIDDSVGMIARNSKLNHFLSRYRHFNANVIMSVQSFRAISPIGRANATDVILMNGITNQKEWEKIEEEYDAMYQGNLEKLYREDASEPYEFLYLKLRKNPPQIYKNFQKLIYPPNKKKTSDNNI
jgi:hypothetical protein